MKQASLFTTLFIALIVLVPSASGQEMPTSEVVEASETAELLGILSVAEEKLLALADEFTKAHYEWRPAEGVRSSAEVFMHMAAINYAFPILVGHQAPASTGLTMENLSTAAPAFEGSLSSKEDIRPVLRGSFEHLRTAIAASDLDRQVEVFGKTRTFRTFWVGVISHLHEHLGQLIAYSRMNGVVPPWSQ